jgi:hypothetical protein
MKPIPAYFNHGFWLVDCPDCGTPNHTQERGQKTFIPFCCTPGITATAYVKVDTMDLQGNPQTIWRPVADLELRSKARKKAQDEGREYTIAWPKEAAEIEAVLLPVDDNHWRCWMPAELEGKHGRGPWGQSLEELQAEVDKNKAEKDAEIAARAAKVGD